MSEMHPKTKVKRKKKKEIELTFILAIVFNCLDVHRHNSRNMIQPGVDEIFKFDSQAAFILNIFFSSVSFNITIENGQLIKLKNDQNDMT